MSLYSEKKKFAAHAENLVLRTVPAEGLLLGFRAEYSVTSQTEPKTKICFGFPKPRPMTTTSVFEYEYLEYEFVREQVLFDFDHKKEKRGKKKLGNKKSGSMRVDFTHFRRSRRSTTTCTVALGTRPDGEPMETSCSLSFLTSMII